MESTDEEEETVKILDSLAQESNKTFTEARENDDATVRWYFDYEDPSNIQPEQVRNYEQSSG
jgi:hypothetical protein